MGWLIVGILIVGGICALVRAWREGMAEHAPTDDEFNHSEGEDD